MNAKPPVPRRLLRVAGFVLGGLAVLVVAAWAAVAVLLPHDRMLALVRDQLSRSLRREMRLADVSVSPWPPVRLRARGFELAEPGGFARGTAARVGALDLDLDLVALFARRFVVRSVTLEEPALHLLLRADGTTNFDSLTAAPATARPAAQPMDLAVRVLTVRGGRLLVDDLLARRRISVGLDTRLGFSLRGDRIATRGRTRLSQLALGSLEARRISDLDRGLARLVWTIGHEGGFDPARRTLELTRLEIGSGRAHLALSGTVKDPGARATLDLRAKGERLDLGDVLRSVAVADARALNGVQGDGRLAFDLAIQGATGPGRLPALTGTLSVTDGSFRYPGAPAGVDHLAFNARFTPDRLDIGDLRARVADQPLRAQLAVTRFADPELRFAVEGTLDLAALSRLLAPRETKLAGRCALNLRGAGRPRDPGAFTLEGRAVLANGSLESPALPRKVQSISGVADFSAQRAAVRGFSASAGKSSFRLDATVSRPLALLAKPDSVAPAELTFHLTSPHLDLGELLPPGPVGPVPLNARGSGRVEIAKFINQKLEVENVRATVGLEPRVIAVPSYQLDAYGGAVQGSARFGFEDPARPRFAVKGRADSLQVDRFLSAWTPMRGLLSGAATTSFDLSGEGAQPEQLRSSLTALGLAVLAEGRLGGPLMQAIAQATRVPALAEVRLRDARLPFRIDRGRVVTDSLRFSGDAGDWLASGLVGFDGSLDYAVSATLPAGLLGRDGLRGALAAGLLSDGHGRVLLDLRVTGSAKAPRVALNVRAMEDRLAGRASSLLKEQGLKLGETLKQSGALRSVTDSTGRTVTQVDTKKLGQELQKQGRDLLEGFFGKKKPQPAPSDSGTPVPPASADSAGRR